MTIRNICICAVQSPFVRGGAEIQLESLQNELSRRGYNVEMVNIPFVWLPARTVLKNCLIWRWMELERCTKHPIDLVISSKFPSYAVRHPRKVTWLIHQFRQMYELYGTQYSNYTDLPEEQEVRRSVLNFDTKMLSESRAIFTESQRVADRLKHYNGLTGKPLYHPPQHWDRHYHNEYGDYILSVSRLSDLKRVDLLIEAITRTSFGVRAIIVGEGEEKTKLERLAEKLEVSDRVDFVGAKWDQDLVDLYANCRAVYYAPYDEDYGLVPLEAFRSRKPVITAKDSGGTLEFVINDETGFVVEPDANPIAAAIEHIFASDEICSRLGENGYEKASFISWDYVVENLLGAAK